MEEPRDLDEPAPHGEPVPPGDYVTSMPDEKGVATIIQGPYRGRTIVLPAAKQPSEIVPKDHHEAIGNQSASILENHSQHVVKEIDGLIDALYKVKEQLVKESSDMRGMVTRHTETMRSASQLSAGIRKALGL